MEANAIRRFRLKAQAGIKHPGVTPLLDRYFDGESVNFLPLETNQTDN
jgi:hypothetical protein